MTADVGAFKHMHLLIFVTLLALCDTSFGASAFWKPAPNEALDTHDPRIQALSAYRRALVIVEVQTYLNSHQSTPGDKEDILITEFQEAVSAHEITLATEFLKDYPDDEVATKLLLFQIKMTSGVWPPWKRLALALFDRCPDIVKKTLPTLSIEERSKFLGDVDLGIKMASGKEATLMYPLPKQRLNQIRITLSQMKQQNYP